MSPTRRAILSPGCNSEVDSASGPTACGNPSPRRRFLLSGAPDGHQRGVRVCHSSVRAHASRVRGVHRRGDCRVWDFLQPLALSLGTAADLTLTLRKWYGLAVAASAAALLVLSVVRASGDGRPAHDRRIRLSSGRDAHSSAGRRSDGARGGGRAERAGGRLVSGGQPWRHGVGRRRRRVASGSPARSKGTPRVKLRPAGPSSRRR